MSKRATTKSESIPTFAYMDFYKPPRRKSRPLLSYIGLNPLSGTRRVVIADAKQYKVVPITKPVPKPPKAGKRKGKKK